MGMFTVIPQSTFEEMQLDAGILLTSFNPASPSVVDSAIVCATTGGITVSCVPTYSDLGEDVDNCPVNMKELKHLDSWECTLGFTSLGVSEANIKLALGAADIGSSSMITPRRDLAQTDFTDLWWVGDRADGGFVAIQIKNALSTGGFSLTTSKSGKGQVAVTLTGHVSMAAQDVVPMVFYSTEGSGLAHIALASFAGSSTGTTSITVSGYTLASGEAYKYKLGSEPAAVTYDQVLSTGWTSWNGSTAITATTGQYITIAAVVSSSNKARAVGSVMVTSA